MPASSGPLGGLGAGDTSKRRKGKNTGRGASFYSRLLTLCGILLALFGLYMFACLRVTSQAGSTPQKATPTTPSPSSMKAVRRIMPPPPQHWVGDGFHVYPVFHDLAFTKELSPWLMFDYAAPKKFSPTNSRRGVGRHPHRGFETVTVAFQGEVEHGDSVGNRDVTG